LLTGRLPFSADELAAGGIDAIRRTIREREPVRPSTRIHNLDSAELRALALRRSLEPPRLIQLLKGDLDWIVMKCLEKDRTRRYATANGLALDIRRYLQHEPVLARPPSTVYRLRKAIRRNELVFASGTAVVLALMLGAGGSIWEAVRANRAEREQTRIWEKSQELARLETVARQAAITSKARAEWMTRQLRTETYAADVRVAQYEIEAGRPGLARELLGQYFPGDGDTADDYRGLEWRFLWTAACQEPTGNQDTASGPIMARLFQSTRTKDAVSATPAPAAEVMPVHSSDGVLTARHVGEGSVELKSVGPQPFQHLLPPGSTNVGRLALSGNGRSLAVAFTDGSAKIWTIDNSRVVGPVSLKNTDVTDMAFTADGKTLIASRRKGGVEFWNAETGRRMLVLDRVMPLFTPGKAIADGFEVEWQMNDGTRLSGFLSAPSLAALDADHHTRGQERP
jgi:hypothetical protein